MSDTPIYHATPPSHSYPLPTGATIFVHSPECAAIQQLELGEVASLNEITRHSFIRCAGCEKVMRDVRADENWCDDPAKVREFISWLAGRDYFDEIEGAPGTRPVVETVLNIIERPRRWTREYKRMLDGLNYDEERCAKCGEPEVEKVLVEWGQCSKCDEKDEERRAEEAE